jgi:hypothetical protein
MSNNNIQNTRVERPDNTIKKIVTPLTNDTKVKTSSALQTVVNKIKEKHL